MLPGETGVVGLNVPEPVVAEKLRGQENVALVGINVGVLLLRTEIVTKVNVSSLKEAGVYSKIFLYMFFRSCRSFLGKLGELVSMYQNLW